MSTHTSPSPSQVVAVNITFDPASFAFTNLSVLPLTCLRASDRTTWRTSASVFGRICAARIDLPDFPHELGPHPWDTWLPQELREHLDGQHRAAVAARAAA